VSSESASFQVESLRAGLRPIAPGEPFVLTPEEDAYLRHYNIHFSDEFPELVHHFGALSTPQHQIAAHLWVPAGAQGTAVVIHGYFDHTGLYGHLLRHLIDRGLAVLSFDLPGHGLSTGAPASIETFQHYVDAFDACLAALGNHLPQPWYLFGQSTGGAIAMDWLLANGYNQQTSPFVKVVLLAPLVRPYLWPVNRLVYEVARRFITERPRTFTSNAENEAFLEFLRERDPLQARTLPVQWVTAMLAWKRRFESHAPTDIAPLVVQGHADRTVDWRYNIKVISRLFQPQVFYIPEARHHLVNESPSIRAKIFQAIDEQIRTAPAS
jgi:lysophospholipase